MRKSLIQLNTAIANMFFFFNEFMLTTMSFSFSLVLKLVYQYIINNIQTEESELLVPGYIL